MIQHFTEVSMCTGTRGQWRAAIYSLAGSMWHAPPMYTLISYDSNIFGDRQLYHGTELVSNKGSMVKKN